MLAAEIFGYSFANYEDHLDIGHVRYEQLMPERVKVLERATQEKWPLAKTASELDISEADAQDLLSGYEQAVAVVDAENPAEFFRNAVRHVVRDAIAQGSSSEAEIEELVRQICYRAADLGYLLDSYGERLSRYSRHLRKEPDVEYHDGYFDENA
jgi:hypothetical protein